MGEIMKYKLVYLEWSDSISNSMWKNLDEAIEWAKGRDWLVRHIGWILVETKKYILIAGSWTPETDSSEEQFGNLQKIPTTWIRKRKILKL